MTTISLLLAVALVSTQAAHPAGQTSSRPETVVVPTGALKLRALIWRPSGPGPLPAVIFNHGSYSTDDPMPADDPATLGPVFVRHGYVFLFLFRQGIGLSSGQGTADGDQMTRALAANGTDGRNSVQLRLLEAEEMNEGLAGLAWLRALPEVDAHRIAVIGHSFGGSLSLLMAARDPTLRAAVIFAGAAASWKQSPELRARLVSAVTRTQAPVFFIHAVNDYSTAPGQALAMEMQRVGKPHLLKIYPAVGRTSREGHNLIYRSVATWERDVFAFLESHLRR